MKKHGSMRIAELLRRVGEENSPQDSILAHITPEEARLLKKRGGSGRIDPVTGLPHFEEGADNNDSATGDTNSGSDQGTYSATDDSGNTGNNNQSSVGGFDSSVISSEEQAALNSFTEAFGQSIGSSLANATEGAIDEAMGSPEGNSWQQYNYVDPATGRGTWDVGGLLGMGPAPDNPNFAGDNQGSSSSAGANDITALNDAWEKSGLNEEAISSHVGMEGRLGDTAAANAEYNALSALGDFDGWSFTDIGGGTNANWGGIANSISGFLNSDPAMAIGTAFLGPNYALAAKGLDVSKNAIAENVLGRGYDQTSKSALNSLGTIGAVLGGPVGQVAGSTIGQAAQGNWGNAAANALTGGLSLSGTNLGNYAASKMDNPYVAAAANLAGQYAQDAMVSQALSSLGIENSGASLGGSASGAGITGDAYGATSDSYAAPTSFSDVESPTPVAEIAPAANYQGFVGSSGGMDIGSSYLQKIKEILDKQSNAFEAQRRKTWYSDGTWEVVK